MKRSVFVLNANPHCIILATFQAQVIFGLMKKHMLRAVDGAHWASRETKLKAESKIEHLIGNFVGTDMFFNYTFLQDRYGRVSTIKTK